MTSTDTRQCRKCLGKGRIPGLDHVDYGKCWNCDGVGTIDHAARKARAERSALVDTLPGVFDLTQAAIAKGVKPGRQAQRAARAYRDILFARLDGEDIAEDPELLALFEG